MPRDRPLAPANRDAATGRSISRRQYGVRAFQRVVLWIRLPSSIVANFPANPDQCIAEAIQFRSLVSLSVGSIISVPGTGRLIVGE